MIDNIKFKKVDLRNIELNLKETLIKKVISILTYIKKNITLPDIVNIFYNILNNENTFDNALI